METYTRARNYMLMLNICTVAVCGCYNGYTPFVRLMCDDQFLYMNNKWL